MYTIFYSRTVQPAATGVDLSNYLVGKPTYWGAKGGKK